MKKIRLLLITVVALILLLALSSCGTNSAKGVFKKINSTMNKLDSHQSEATVNASVRINERWVRISGHTKEVLYNLSGKDCYVYSETNTRTTVDNSATDIMRIKAYNDGTAYSYAVSGGSVQSICSPLSRREFLKYYQYNTSDFDTKDLYDCANRTFEEIDGGGWVVKFSGYGEEVINSYLSSMGLAAGVMDDKAVDMEITLRANSEFRATSMTMRIIFDGENGSGAIKPKIESTIYYSAYNSVVPETDNLNPAYYKEVADVRLADGIQYMIEDFQNRRSGRFTLEVTQDNGKATYSEESIVRFGTSGGKYHYEIEAEIEGKDRDITYSNGEKITVNNGKEKKEKQSDAEARSFINGLINSANYNAVYVEDIVETGKGIYKITLDISNVEQYKDLLGGAYLNADQTIYVTIKRKKIDKIESHVTINYYGGELNVTSIVDCS